MKLVWFVFLLSFASLAQVTSVDILAIPDVQPSIDPSFSEQSKRLCFVMRNEGKVTIMLSELSTSGDWSKPYTVFTLSKKDLVEGVSINEKGNRIYLGLNNDIYLIDYLGGSSWSIPLKIGIPISGELGEHQPSFFDSDQELFFLRGVKDVKSGNWVRRAFYSKKNLSWSAPKMISFNGIEFDDSEFFGFRVMPTNRTCLLTTSVKPSAHNYIGQLRDSVITNFREINFSGGAIRWISHDFTFGFGMTYTNPAKIIKINFDRDWFSIDKVQTQEPLASRNSIDSEGKPESVKPSGKYYGLLIGVSQYQDSKLNLDKPVRDTQQLSDLLINHYSFDKKDVTMLSNPTRQEIMSELYKLRSVITPNDNLLIFFAGHGFWDESIRQGNWWPKDAQANNPSFWLSNSDLREQIRGINSAHTLLISDACFSGGIFKTRDAGEITKASLDIQVLYKTKSRRAITSGNLSAVPDRSVFFEYLTNKLMVNEENFMPAQKLFYSLKTAVIHNSLNIPQEGVITEAGDEGGDFIFIRKQQ